MHVKYFTRNLNFKVKRSTSWISKVTLKTEVCKFLYFSYVLVPLCLDHCHFLLLWAMAGRLSQATQERDLEPFWVQWSDMTTINWLQIALLCCKWQPGSRAFWFLGLLLAWALISNFFLLISDSNFFFWTFIKNVSKKVPKQT